MKLGILGYKGFVGSIVYQYFKKIYELDVIGIAKEDHTTEFFNILINCAGSSRKHYAEENPEEDKIVCENLIVKLSEFRYENIIHISSIDALDNTIVYGRNKLLVEEVIRNQNDIWTIIRLSGLVGGNLKKNVVYDMINNNKVWVSGDSVYNYIDISFLPIVIMDHLQTKNYNLLFNFAASENISVKDIAEIFQKDVEYGSRLEVYDNIDITYIKKLVTVHPSRYYIEKYYQSISGKGG